MRTKEGNKEKDIIEASIKVFAEHGYHEAKISEVAKRAGVATGSVYLYFKTKDAILDKIFESLWKDLETSMRSIVARPDMNPIEKLDCMIDLFFDRLIDNPQLAIVFANELPFILRDRNASFAKSYEKFLGFAAEVFREGMKEGVINSHIEVNITRHFLIGGLRTLVREWAHDQKAVPLNTIRNGVKLLIKHGIVNKGK